MSDSYEQKVIEFEHARNRAMDEYFTARPHTIRSREAEGLFEGGFRMAWEHLKEAAESQEFCIDEESKASASLK